MSVRSESIVCLIFAVLIAILILIINVGVYLYFRDHVERKKQSEKVNRTLFTVSVLFFIVTIVWLCVVEAFWITETYRQWTFEISLHGRGTKVLLASIKYVYFAQYLAMISLSILRLYYVFEDSQFEMTKRGQRMYFALFIITVALVVANGILSSVTPHMQLASSVYVVCVALMIGQAVVLTSAFVVRLHQVHSQATGGVKGDNLLKTIRKHAILATFSVLFTIVGVSSCYYAVVQNYIFTSVAVHHAALIGDVVSNALFVMLTLNVFDKHYVILCGCIDKSVHRCVKRTMQTRADKHLEADLQVVSTPTQQSHIVVDE